MRASIFALLLASFFLVAVPAQAKPCIVLAGKVCKSLGPKAFLCGTYKLVAAHKKANQTLCMELIQNWKQRKLVLKREEQTIKQMDQLGKTGGAVMKKQVEAQKLRTRQQTVAQMLVGAKAPKPRNNDKACEKLPKQVCGDLGDRSFFCNAFRQAAGKPGVQKHRCALVLDNWAASQQAEYRRREALIARMSKAAKGKPKLQKRLAFVKQKQLQSLTNFLQQP